jgi:DNA-binding response OmpR family regulator
MGVAASNSAPRILVAEDNFLMAEVICDFVDSCGFQVIGPASSVESGRHLALEEEIDAALLDINLDGSLCFPICLVLARRHVPFIFLSGYSTTNQLVPGEFKGAPFVEKPFTPEELQPLLLDMVSSRVGAHRQKGGSVPSSRIAI